MEPVRGATITGLEPLRVWHFVDGRRIAGSGERTHRLDPRLGDRGRTGVPIATPDEVDEMLVLAGEGLARWLAYGPVARRCAVAAVHRACVDATFDFAEAVADDFGIPCEAAATVAVSSIRRLGTLVGEHQPARPSRGLHVVSVGPSLSGRQFVDLVWPVLLDGSTVVVFPGLDSPRTASLLAELASDAGLPDGVLNVILGDDETLAALRSSPLVWGVVGTRPGVTNR